MANETIIKKLENGRAEFAYKCVQEAKNPDKCYKFKQSEYRSYAKKLPVLIQTNGLGNTLAFIISKSKGDGKEKNAYDLLYDQFSQWLKEKSNSVQIPGDKDILEFVISTNSSTYRQITHEILAFLNWLRRLAEGMIEGDDEE